MSGAFDPEMRDIIQKIKSNDIRKMANYLYNMGIPVIYYGKAWSGCTNNWIYFDIVLDINNMQNKFNLDKSLQLHENLDPKSGRERGWIDNQTGEAIMGKI